jgi:hypothetical protein
MRKVAAILEAEDRTHEHAHRPGHAKAVSQQLIRAPTGCRLKIRPHALKERVRGGDREVVAADQRCQPVALHRNWSLPAGDAVDVISSLLKKALCLPGGSRRIDAVVTPPAPRIEPFDVIPPARWKQTTRKRKRPAVPLNRVPLHRSAGRERVSDWRHRNRQRSYRRWPLLS